MNKEEQESLYTEYHRLGNLLVTRDNTIEHLRAEVKALKKENFNQRLQISTHGAFLIMHGLTEKFEDWIN